MLEHAVMWGYLEPCTVVAAELAWMTNPNKAPPMWHALEREALFATRSPDGQTNHWSVGGRAEKARPARDAKLKKAKRQAVAKKAAKKRKAKRKAPAKRKASGKKKAKKTRKKK